jgi:hypothetical protein
VQVPKIVLILTVASIAATPAWPIQIGPEIRIGGGEATFGGVGVKNGKVVVPTPDQLLDTAINSTPLTLLSDADKRNVKQAIVTTGFVMAVVSDPITGIVLITVLQGNGDKTDVPVPTVNAPPTGKVVELAAKCIVQQAGGTITAMLNDDAPRLAELAAGDTLKLSAGYCPEYQKNSVTSVTVKYSGRSDFPDAKPPLYKHYIVGRTT